MAAITDKVKLKDVAHFYIGRDVQYSDKNGNWRGKLLTYDPNTCELLACNSSKQDYVLEINLSKMPKGSSIKLMLKSVANINVTDGNKYYSLCKKKVIGNEKITSDTYKSFLFLIKNGYDAFDLIENNQAINIL